MQLINYRELLNSLPTSFISFLLLLKVYVCVMQDQDQSIQNNGEFGFDAQSLGSSCT